jgi:hypothetical protein
MDGRCSNCQNELEPLGKALPCRCKEKVERPAGVCAWEFWCNLHRPAATNPKQELNYLVTLARCTNALMQEVLENGRCHAAMVNHLGLMLSTVGNWQDALEQEAVG